jgi:uncharacterized membrane protein YhfC
MVSSLSIIFMVITELIVFLFPIGLMIYFYRKEKISFIAVLVGALVFFVSQVVLRIPMLQILGRQQWYIKMAQNIWLIGPFLGLTAGIFEEVGRFLGFRFLLKNKLEWKNGVAFGIGHGGIEAIILTGLTYINNIVFSILINTGAMDKVAGAFPAGLAEQITAALANTNPMMFLVAGIERVFAITAHIAFSFLFGVLRIAYHLELTPSQVKFKKYFQAFRRNLKKFRKAF